MKKIAVFGKSGGGKSTFSKKLSLAIGITFKEMDKCLEDLQKVSQVFKEK